MNKRDKNKGVINVEAAQREKNRLLLCKPYRDMEIWDTLARHLGVRLMCDDEQAPAAAEEGRIGHSAIDD